MKKKSLNFKNKITKHQMVTKDGQNEGRVKEFEFSPYLTKQIL